jgi:hypothetical protein
MSTRPGLRRRLLEAWLAIAVRFGEVQTLVMLALIYTLVIGLAGLIAQLARRDLLSKRGLFAGESAWQPAEAAPASLERAKLQS